MVTRPSAARFPFLKRSIECYLQQSHAARELVVLVDPATEADNRRELERHVSALAREDIRLVSASGTPTLGQLRNLSRDHARGDVMCVWDDDDVHHPLQLEIQGNALETQNAIAVFLSEALHLFHASGEIYWTNWRNTVQKCLPSTGMFRREVRARYPETGPESLRGEDTVFTLRLLEEGNVYMLADSAHLYTYVAHGINISGDEHHRMVARELAVSRGRLLKHRAEICDALDRSPLDLSTVRVLGNNGDAFAWSR
jgi:glycosyltransferase involved in cell wall biosynthesis